MLLKQPEESNLNLPVWDPRVRDLQNFKDDSLNYSLVKNNSSCACPSSFRITLVLSVPLLCFLVQVMYISSGDPNLMSFKITHTRLDEWEFQPKCHNPLLKAVLQVINY